VRALVCLLALVTLAGEPEPAAPRVVEVVAKRFEFSPKEVTLKKGERVTLRLSSEDVRHGFFSRALGVDAEIVPGKTTEVTIVAPQTAGAVTVICNRYCGSGHGGMKMRVVVE
jgi:cytochrome c oxidase subunit 2